MWATEAGLKGSISFFSLPTDGTFSPLPSALRGSRTRKEGPILRLTCSRSSVQSPAGTPALTLEKPIVKRSRPSLFSDLLEKEEGDVSIY